MLRTTKRQMQKEGAVNAKDLTSSGDVGVMVHNKNNANTVVIYNTKKLLENISKRIKMNDLPSAWKFDEVTDPAIISYISSGTLKKLYPETNIVGSSVTTKSGYGPIVYDLLMATVYPEWIVSDRETVSNAARAVWKYMLQKRPDIEHELVPIYAEIVSLLEQAKGDPRHPATKALANRLETVSLSSIIATDTNVYSYTETEILLDAISDKVLVTKKPYQDEAVKLIQMLKAAPLAYRYRLKDGFQKSPYLKPLYDNHKKTMDSLSRIPQIVNLAKQARKETKAFLEISLEGAGISIFSDSL